MKYFSAFTGIGGFVLWYNQAWETDTSIFLYHQKKNWKNFILSKDSIKQRLGKSLVSVKRLCGHGLKNSVLNQEFQKRETSSEKTTTLGKVRMPAMPHFILEFKRLGERLIDVRCAKKVDTLNGQTLMGNSTMFQIIK